MKVAVIGGAGYVAGELLRLLIGHPEVRQLRAFSRSRAGRSIGEIHPALAGRTAQRFESAAPAEAAAGHDVVFLALEHGESSRLLAGLLGADPGLVIDLAADFRVRDLSLHERYYGPHAAADLAATFHYALADVAGTELRGLKRLAVPGCFATATQIALRPLAKLSFVSPPVAFAVTGSSGAGARSRETTHHPARANNFFAYSVGGHRHEAEIVEQWRAWAGPEAGEPRLLAHSGPFVRGIHLTLFARLATPTDVAPLTQRAWAGRPFVRVLQAPPELTHVVGTNQALVHAATSANGHDVVVQVAIDNLIKGAAGQAVQSMNLSLGLDEEAGLRLSGIFPC